jgi:hypothetical protein
MSLFLESKARSYCAIRAASQGASVSLLHGCGEYVAMLSCAMSIAAALGQSAQDSDGVPIFRIPLDQMVPVCLKLAERMSVALLDVVCEESLRFVMVWKIPCVPLPSEDWKQSDVNLDEY